MAHCLWKESPSHYSTRVMASGIQFDSAVPPPYPPLFMCIYAPICMMVRRYVVPKVKDGSHSSENINLTLLSQGLSQAWIWPSRPTLSPNTIRSGSFTW